MILILFEPSESHPWLTAWASIGPLIGVLVGSYLAQRGQRQQWIADNKKQEFRELLTSLTSAYAEIVRRHQASIYVPSREEEIAYDLAIKNSATVLIDRVFISPEICELKVAARWNGALVALSESRDIDVFCDRFSSLQKSITDAALRVMQ